MPDSSTLFFYTITVPNKPGEGAKVLTALKDAGVNFTGIWGYPVKGRKSALDLTPDNAGAFSKAARKLKLEVSEKKPALYVTGADHMGALAELLAKLGAAGVNVYAAQATCAGQGQFAALIQVAPEDLKAAKKAISK
jgi:hypothetical protein